MKKKRLFIKICFILVFVFGGFIWYNVPCSITNIAPSEVSEIEILDGNTGKSISITNAIDIEHIINNINMVSLKKEKISLLNTGYSYRIKVYKVNRDVYKEFIINSNNTIRKDPFFYRDSTNSIDYNYIQKLFKKIPNK